MRLVKSTGIKVGNGLDFSKDLLIKATYLCEENVEENVTNTIFWYTC